MIARRLLPLALLAWPATAPAQIGTNAVGMNTHIPHADVMDAYADAGIGWIRIDVNWEQGEPDAQGRYVWGHLDPVIDGAVARGLRVFMTIGYTPAWASAGNADGERRGNDVPRPGLYERYVEEVVRRYADRVQHYGMWNEPNLRGFFEGTLQQYVDLILRPGAAAVRRACPGCYVLGPELAGIGGDWSGSWQEDLEQALRLGGDLFDIVTHHTYRGFAETHDGIMWMCDDFAHQLEAHTDVFCLYTRGVVEVMADAGYEPGDLEVWLTEIGYRTEPVGDAGEEDRQATYVRLALEEQLSRDWWTNTFFYEALDCECGEPGPAWGCMPQGSCSIDGYGLLRRTAAPDGGWGDNFRRKPSYEMLRQTIADHEELRPAEPPRPAECANGADDDGDGLTDLADPGCSDREDDDESDDPEAPAYEARGLRSGPTIDGDLSDWAGPWVRLGAGDWVPLQGGYGGDDDLSARFAVAWTPDDLYLAVEVTDDAHHNDRPEPELWLGDCVQVALDIGANGDVGYDGDDYELGFARLEGGTARYRWAGPNGPGDFDAELAVDRDGSTTSYELRLPGFEVPPLRLAHGARLGFSLLVNDDDGAGRDGWLEWTPGIGHAKVPGAFGRLVLGARPPGEGEGEGPTEGEGEGAGEGEGEGPAEGEGEGPAEGEGEGPAEGEGEGPAEGEGETPAEGEGEGPAEGEGEGDGRGQIGPPDDSERAEDEGGCACGIAGGGPGGWSPLAGLAVALGARRRTNNGR